MTVLAPAKSFAEAAKLAPEVFSLDNGMQVVVIPDRRAPVVTHMVWYRVGAADEPSGRSGIAHFLEHLMFKGTDDIPEGEFSKIVARNGGRDNAFTSWDFTAYFQRVARDRLEIVMEMEADRMRNLRLSEEAVATEREVIHEERRSRIDNRPDGLLRERMAAALYIHHPYGIPIIGWDHEIAALDRQDAFDFYAEYYDPSNAILIVAGDIDAEELRPLAEKYYGKHESRFTVERVRPQEPPAIMPRRLTLEDERVSQPSFSRWYLAPSRATAEPGEAEALELLSDILGGGPTSRLYRALVEEQKVAASVSTYYGRDAVDQTAFYLSATPRAGVSLEQLEAAVDATLESFFSEGVTAAELTRAQRTVVDGYIYAQDSQQSMAYTFGVALTTGLDVDDVIEWPTRVEAVSAEQVLEAAKGVLQPARSVTGHLLPATPASEG